MSVTTFNLLYGTDIKQTYSYSKWTGRLVAILEISIWVFVHSLDKQLKIV